MKLVILSKQGIPVRDLLLKEAEHVIEIEISCGVSKLMAAKKRF